MGGQIAVYLVMAVLVLLALFAMMATRYRKCPSDRIMVIYGKTGSKGAARCIHGGAKFIFPVIQDYGYISLRPLQIDVKLYNALCKQNIRINVPSVFTVGVSTRPEIMGNAAERLFGQSPDAIAELSKDIIFGQLRLVIASMTIEEINADRETFLRSVEANVAEELNKIGLELLNVNITDITDESGYIDAIGRKAASEAINKAKVDVAEESRKGSIGEAEAKKQERISVSEAEAQAVAGEADAARERRIAVANAETLAVTGEDNLPIGECCGYRGECHNHVAIAFPRVHGAGIQNLLLFYACLREHLGCAWVVNHSYLVAKVECSTHTLLPKLRQHNDDIGFREQVTVYVAVLPVDCRIRGKGMEMHYHFFTRQLCQGHEQALAHCRWRLTRVNVHDAIERQEADIFN